VKIATLGQNNVTDLLRMAKHTIIERKWEEAEVAVIPAKTEGKWMQEFCRWAEGRGIPLYYAETIGKLPYGIPFDENKPLLFRAEEKQESPVAAQVTPPVVIIPPVSKTPTNLVLYAEWHTGHRYGGAAQASAVLTEALHKRDIPITRVNYEECLSDDMSKLSPKVVITCGDLPKNAVDRLIYLYPKASFVQYIQDPGYIDRRWELYKLVIVNSPFVQKWLLEQGGPQAEIQAPHPSQEYARVDNVMPKYVLSVHISNHKGGSLFKKIAAAMPDVQFVGIDQSGEIKNAFTIGNLTILPFVDKIADVYRECAALIQPSMFLEAYCRAVVEAVGNGIPTVVSDWGNLPNLAAQWPDMVRVVGRDAPVEEWAGAVRAALANPRIRHPEAWSDDVSVLERAVLSLGIKPIEKKLSICITLKNRAEFMDGFFTDLKRQNYDLKNVEVCVTDGDSTDNLMAVLRKHWKTVGQVKYARSDRSRLPFKVMSNCPAADINAQIANVASYEKIIRTDAEMRFSNPDTLRLVAEKLEDPDMCFTLAQARLLEGHRYPEDGEPVKFRDHHLANGIYWDSFFFSAFNKSKFIEMGGVDERFCLGFAAEDTYFHWYWKKHAHYEHSTLDYKALHLYHPDPMIPEYMKLRNEYTWPMFERFKRDDVRPNSHLLGTEWRRPEMISGVRIVKDYPVGITVHCMIRNEPLVYYAVKSVYPYVQRILIYDDASTDIFTADQLKVLKDDDTDNKIEIKRFNRKQDGSRWNYETVAKWGEVKTGDYKKCDLRRMMMDATTTSHFMILDGDEVYYPETMEKVVDITKNWPKGKICGRVPLTWYASRNLIHAKDGPVGRIFLTEAVGITSIAPGERHTNKNTGEKLCGGMLEVFDIDCTPYAHFEAWLKPWRRDIDYEKCAAPERELPPIFKQRPYFIDTYETARRASIVNFFIQEANQFESVLDIGCGAEPWFPQLSCKRKVGIDGFAPVLEDAKKGKPEAEFICMDTRDIKKNFKDGEFDTVMGVDIIEHLDDKRAVMAIKDCENIAREVVLFFIPVGIHKQCKDPNSGGNDKLQTHRSTWIPEDMAELGYEVWHFSDWHQNKAKSAGAMWCIKRKHLPYSPGVIHNLKSKL